MSFSGLHAFMCGSNYTAGDTNLTIYPSEAFTRTLLVIFTAKCCSTVCRLFYNSVGYVITMSHLPSSTNRKLKSLQKKRELN